MLINLSQQRHFLARVAILDVLCFLAVGSLPSVSAEEPRQTIEFFESKVRPLLVEHCYECHSEKSKKLKAELYLDSREDILKGGESGPAVVPGDPDDSLLMSAVLYESFEMPPRGRLKDDQIAILRKWIQDGAYWPAEPNSANRERAAQFDLETRMQSHWSWKPLAQPRVPDVDQSDWPLNAVDHFVLAKLEAAGLAPASQADRRSLIRRLYFDLVGLPPSQEEIRAFTESTDPRSYERLVDRLLDSKQFGEKWARHWLDLVRYGEACGHEFDYPLPYAYQYRDYVIRAFNADVRYDQFVMEHIAGDLLNHPRRHSDEGFNESIIGTGFWFLGEAVHAPTDVRGDEADRIDNQLDVMSKAFLGLTVACARCHDHKFDPIVTADYYALTGFLQSSRRQDAMLDPNAQIMGHTKGLSEQLRTGSQLMQDASNRSSGSLSDYLMAALAVKRDQRELQQVALSLGLQTRVLQQMIDALNSNSVAQPTHPMFVWRRLVWDAKADQVGNLSESLLHLRKELDRLEDEHRNAESQIQWFHDFQKDGFDGWYVTGEAFGEQPTESGSWNAFRPSPQFLEPGLAHSGFRGRHLQGVIRSPTFVLGHRRIHYQMSGRKARIRLIVDGYVMDIHNALLFQDITLEDVNTKGKHKWVTQHQDLYHYVGHRAHIEIIDKGDGYASVERIGFSDGGPPPDAPNTLCLDLVNNQKWSSAAELAEAYERRVATSLTKLRNQSLGKSNTQFLNWLLSCGQLEVDNGQLRKLRDKMAKLDQEVPAPVKVMALVDGDGEDDRIHIRGSHKNLGDVVHRRFLTAIAGEDQPQISGGSGRLQLAQRMVDPTNPFISRVLVNRLWHHLLGLGIVPSVDDFGAMGLPPSHPQLLDWLAQDFINNDWSMKRSIRQLVTSRTYQMSTAYSAPQKALAVDPDNTLLHKARVRRLPAESIRDAMLSVAGSLNSSMYGPSVPVHLTPFMEGRGRPKSGPLDGEGRRAIYVKIQRNFLSPMMLAFDMPSPFSTMGRRSNSNVPAQSLILMNDPFVWEQAELWSRRLLEDETLTPAARINVVFEAGIGRPPTPEQLRRVESFLDGQMRLYECGSDDPRIWADFCHVVMNMKDFIYLN